MQNITENHIRYIISRYNKITSKNAQYASQKNIDAANRALTAAANLSELETYMKKAFDEKRPGWDTCDGMLLAFCREAGGVPEPQPIPQPAPAATPQPAPAATPQPEAPKKGATAEDVLTEIIGAAIEKMDLTGKIIEPVKASMQGDIDKYIAETYGPIKRDTVIKINKDEIKVKGVTHKKFPFILTQLLNDCIPFLVGPAGSGKTSIGKQAAEVLKREFYFSGAVSQVYQFEGYTDAKGEYQETQFYKAFKNGGVFLLDEIDASNPDVLVRLNTALANRYYDFPAPIGKVEAHPDFCAMAAGNTYGLGADYEYVGRNQLDAATLDRFVMVEVDYDPDIESYCAGGDKKLLDFCRAFRKSVQKAGIKALVSYRAITNLHKLWSVWDDKVEVLKSCLTKSLGKQDLEIIYVDCKKYGEYSDALYELVTA